MMFIDVSFGIGTLFILAAALFASAVRILREYERAVVFQLGRFWKVKGPVRVIDPEKAIVQVLDYMERPASSRRPRMRTMLGKHELDEMPAERERRAKVIHAEGELQASEKLQQAALVLSRQSGAMQLRY